MHPRIQLASLAARALQAHGLLVHQNLQFPLHLLSNRSSPSLCLGLFLPRYCTPLLNCIRFLPAQVSIQPVWVSLNRSTAFGSLLPVFYHQQTCCGSTLPLHQDGWQQDWIQYWSLRTLLATDLQLHPVLWITILCALPLDQLSICATVHSFNPYFPSLPMKMLWEAVSKALLKPRETSTSLPSSTWSVMPLYKAVRLIKNDFAFD